MEILVVMSSLHGGGAEKSLISFLTTLESRYMENVHVDLLLLQPEGLFVNQVPSSVNMIKDSKELYCMSYPPTNKMYWKNISLRGIFGKLYHYVQNAKNRGKSGLSDRQAMWEHWKRFIPTIQKEYDVAISYMHGVPNYIVIDKCKAKKKYVYVHHEYEKMNDDWNYDRQYFSKADEVITVSDKCVTSILNAHPMLKGKVVAIENIHSSELIEKLAQSGEAEEFLVDSSTTKILSIGRLTEVKRFDRAIEAAKILKSEGRHFLWVLIGVGELEATLKEKVREFGLDSYFLFVGQKSNPYVYINAADIFVQTSDNEGKSMVIDEAKILKKPIVVTNYMTVRDVIEHRKNGMIAEFSPESVAEQIQTLIDDSKLRNMIINNLNNEKIGNEDEIEKYISLWSK